jgi:hypothetical protein
LVLVSICPYGTPALLVRLQAEELYQKLDCNADRFPSRDILLQIADPDAQSLRSSRCLSTLNSRPTLSDASENNEAILAGSPSWAPCVFPNLDMRRPEQGGIAGTVRDPVLRNPPSRKQPAHRRPIEQGSCNRALATGLFFLAAWSLGG